MKYLKFDYQEKCAAFFFMPLAAFLGGLLGLGGILIQAAIAPGSGTGYPVSTVLSFVGSFSSILYYMGNYRGGFMLALSMGQTRKSYILYFVVRQSLLILVSVGIVYLFDGLQCRLPEYLPGLTPVSTHLMGNIRNPLIMGVLNLLLTVFLSAMLTRFGSKVMMALLLVLFLLALVLDLFSARVVPFYDTHQNLIWILSALIAGSMVLSSIGIARRQSYQ